MTLRYSPHARERMRRRGIKMKHVAAAVEAGERFRQPDGKTVIYHEGLTVVLSADNRKWVLTAYWGRFKPEHVRRPVRKEHVAWLARVWGAA